MADMSPAGGPHTRQERGYYRGVASVRQPPPSFVDTADLTPVDSFGPPAEPPGPPVRAVARPGRPVQPGRGMIVRRRWSRLRAGAGWTWTGGSVLLVCWGIWAVSVRGSGLVGPTVLLGLVLAAGAMVFVVSRLLGRRVLERLLGKERTSAWPSHLAVCLFLTLAGLAFLENTRWVIESWQWFGSIGDWLGAGWEWLLDQWPV
jgi:hypothetical protein